MWIKEKQQQVTITTKEGRTFLGYELREMRDDWSGVLQVECICEDGTIAAVSKEEIIKEKNVILTEEKGGYRLIIAQEGYPRRWCKGVTLLHCVEEND